MSVPEKSFKKVKAKKKKVTIKVALTSELEQKILYGALEVEVLEPASLRERITEIARGIASRS
ncbi:MAG: WYL domain-containing protein [Verrucomicrobiaceae bacterium]|nr:MAG: WYL domain-containing protein [Verrucomicrobiaceae bacterium]